jgi:spoIIIJ-associated protein
MDSVEASGKSVDDAILQALARLGRRRDEVEVAVLQEPSRGVRGVGAHDARVRVWLKRPTRPAPRGDARPSAVLTPDLADQWIDGMEEEEPAPPPIQRVPSAFRPTQPVPPPVVYDDDEDDDDADYDDDEEEEDEEEPEAPPLPQVTVDLGALEDESGELAAGAVPDAVARQALDILRTLLHHMSLPVAIEMSSRDPLTLNINTNGDSNLMSMFIGHRGETLAALQLIVNLMLNHKMNDRFHVVVDIEHYRQRRDENLRSLALRVAQQVQQSQRSMTLEPMTPYERRIVHLTLQDLPAVQTQSTGEGEQRRVVVSLKRPGR